MFGSGWLYPILISIGMIAVLTAMEMLSLAISEKMAGDSGPRLKGEMTQKAA